MIEEVRICFRFWNRFICSRILVMVDDLVFIFVGKNDVRSMEIC